MAGDSSNIAIFSILLLLFILLGSLLPLLNSEYGTNASTLNVGSPSEPSGLDFLLSILTVAFWSFDVNIWVNILLLEPIRILFYIVIYRLINPFA